MKLNKFFLGLLGLSAMVMTSCSDSDDYQWASITGGDQVYFSNTLPTTRNLSMSETKFIVPVTRVTTTNATTVNISLTSDDNFLSAPSSVSFPAGASTAELVVSYDPQALGYDNFKNAVLKITDEGQTNAYGYSTYSFTAGIPSPYKSLGKGTFAEGYLWGKTVSVTIMQNQEKKNTFRVMAPFANISGGGDDYLEISILKPGDAVGDVTITQQDLVNYDSFDTGEQYDEGTPNIFIHHPRRFTNTGTEESWLHNRVLAYQENGLPGQIQLAPRYYVDGLGGWNVSQNDGIIVITFPGYAPKDLSADMEYIGVLTDVAGVASAAVNLTLGADVADARALVVSADADADAVADAIAAGDVEATPVTAGTNYVAIGEGLTGKLMVVLVVLDGGAVKTVSTINFEYYGGGANPWESLGMGIYTDDFVFPLYTKGNPASDPYEVEVQKNTETPGIYRMVDPYGATFPYYEYAESYVPTNIEINAEDPEGVYIPLQSTGLTLSAADGLLSICSYGGYMLNSYDFDVLKKNGYFGTLKDGVFTLPSFEYKNKDTGEVQFTYSGLIDAGGLSYTGYNDAFKLVLPSAVTGSARAKARANSKARDFARRMFGENKFDAKKTLRERVTNHELLAK